MRSPCQCAVAVSQSMASPSASFWMTIVSGDEVSRRFGGADGQPVRVGEPERAVIEAPHVESTLVHQPVMGRTQEDEVVE